MKIFFEVILSIILLVLVLLTIKYKIELKIDLLTFEVKVFNIKIFAKKEQALYDFIVQEMRKVEKAKIDKGFQKEILKTLHIRKLVFTLGIDKTSQLQ